MRDDWNDKPEWSVGVDTGERTELDEVYDRLDKAKAANSALRSSLRDFVAIMEMDIELGRVPHGDTRRLMIAIANGLMQKGE